MSYKDPKREIRGYRQPKDAETLSYSKCDIRLTKRENDMLNELAERNGVSRSDVMRRALLNEYKWNSGE